MHNILLHIAIHIYIYVYIYIYVIMCIYIYIYAIVKYIAHHIGLSKKGATRVLPSRPVWLGDEDCSCSVRMFLPRLMFA